MQDQNVDVIYRKLLSKACMSGKGGVVHTLDGSAWAFFKRLAPKLLVIGWLIPGGSWILLLQWTRQDPVQYKEWNNKKTGHDSILALIFLPVEDVGVVAWTTLPMSPSTRLFPLTQGRPALAPASFYFPVGPAAPRHHERETWVKIKELLVDTRIGQETLSHQTVLVGNIINENLVLTN